MRSIWLPGLSLAVLALAAFPVHAQTVIGAKSGVINWVEGDVFLADKPYVMQPSQFGEVKETMVFRTEEGRAEFYFPRVSFSAWGEKSSFKMISNRLIDTRVELLTGSAVMEIDDMAKEASVTVLCKDGTITLSKAGLYRFDTEPAEIKVYKGSADVAVKGQTVVVGAGKMVQFDAAVAMAEKFSVTDTDSLDRWSRPAGRSSGQCEHFRGEAGHYGGYGVSNPCSTYGGYNTGPFMKPWGTWGYNPYYGMGTYIPAMARCTVRTATAIGARWQSTAPLFASACLCAFYEQWQFWLRAVLSHDGFYGGRILRYGRIRAFRFRKRAGRGQFRFERGVFGRVILGRTRLGRIRRARQIAAAFRST